MISRTDIEKIAPVNFADLIGQLPGFQIEITGGEVQNIYRIRGLPNDAGDKMERVYMLEKRDGFSNFADKDVRALIYTQTATGAAMLRDMLCRAWAESAITPVESRPSPIDLANPRFNPETGSAPD